MVTDTSEKINSHAVYRSLRKQPIFCYVNTGFLRNERRNSKLMSCYHPTVGNASDWLIGLYVGSNRPFSSCTKPQFQSEAKRETHFHKRGFALSLVLKEREFLETRKWAVGLNKTTILHMQHAFLRFLPSSLGCDATRFLEDVNTKRQFPFSFSELWYGCQEFSSRKIRQHLTNWRRQNISNEFWNSTKSHFWWRFRCRLRRGCLSCLLSSSGARVRGLTRRHLLHHLAVTSEDPRSLAPTAPFFGEVVKASDLESSENQWRQLH